MVEVVTYLLIGVAVAEHYDANRQISLLFVVWLILTWPFFVTEALLKKYPMVEKNKESLLTEDI